jgi:transposase
MATSTPNKFCVELTSEQREELFDITRNGRSPAKKIRRAQVLLWSDHGQPEEYLTRDAIAERLGMHVNSVDRIRKQFVLEGAGPALNRKKRETPPTPAKIDGEVEARLIAICCSEAPEGRTHWTLRMLADELMKRRIVTQVCPETVRKALKKTSFSLGGRNAGAFRRRTRLGS